VRGNKYDKFRMQGLNTNKRIIATLGPRKDRNHVIEGSQDLILSLTCVDTQVLSFEELFPEPLSQLENVVCTFLYSA
jgi:hypothetical protein